MSRGRCAASEMRIPRPERKRDTGRRKYRMADQISDEQRARLLRAWPLAVLRCAVTHANAHRLGVFAIANEIDRLGRQDKSTEGFRFFRRTTAELCTAVLRQDPDNDILGSYLAQI